jgi:hypothetical protein
VSRNIWAAVGSIRYSRFGPAHRALKVQVLMATTVSSWNNGPRVAKPHASAAAGRWRLQVDVEPPWVVCVSGCLGSGSVGDGRDDGPLDQELGVRALLVAVAGDHHHQVQLRDDLDELAAGPNSDKAGMGIHPGRPPLVAIAIPGIDEDSLMRGRVEAAT